MEVVLNFDKIDNSDNTINLEGYEPVLAFFISEKEGKGQAIVNCPDVNLPSYIKLLYQTMLEDLAKSCDKLALLIKSIEALGELQSKLKKDTEDKQDS